MEIKISDKIAEELRRQGMYQIAETVHDDLSGVASAYLPPLDTWHKMAIVLATLLTGDSKNAKIIYQNSLDMKIKSHGDLLQRIFTLFPEAEERWKARIESLSQPAT